MDHEELLRALESGELRAAEPDGQGGWRVHVEVKEAILELFRSSPIVEHGLECGARTAAGAPLAFRDKAPLSVRRFDAASDVRLVPGGSSVRRGAYLGPGVVCMPPMYVNIGAWMGAGSMIDSHALVGSCAQVGERVHVSAAAQIGGVLEPAGARPVVVEDGAFVGGNCGIYEGVRIGAGAVIGAGVVLAATTPVFDLVSGSELRGTREAPLEVPERAVVVPGTRPVAEGYGAGLGLALACALIVKYRSASTDAATALEDALRPAGGTT